MTYPTPPPPPFLFQTLNWREYMAGIESCIHVWVHLWLGFVSARDIAFSWRDCEVHLAAWNPPPPPKTPEPSLTPQSARKQHLLFHPIALSTVVTTKYPSAGSTSRQPPLPQTPDIKAVHQAIGPASASNADKALLRAHTRSPCPAVLMRQEHLLNTPPTSASTRSLARGTFPLGLISASPPTTSAQRCGIPTDRAHVGVDYFT